MARAGTVTIDLDASSVKLLRELKKSQRATETTAKKMRSSMTRAFKAIRATVLSAGAAMATFGAIRGFNRIAGEIDQIGKLVDRLGGSTEAFSELQFVAERSGLAFNTLTMGLQRMQRRVAEAAVGTGEAVNALKELGVSAITLSQMPLDVQFERIADALGTVSKESDRTRLAMKLFDSEGVALLQTMKDGSDGIRELREESRRLGRSFSEEQVQAATDAKDAMTNLDASLNALSDTMALRLAPWMTNVTDGLRRMFGAFGVEEEIALMQAQLENLLASGLTLDDSAVRMTIDALNAALKEKAEKESIVVNVTPKISPDASIALFEEANSILDELFDSDRTKELDDYNKALDTVRQRFESAEDKADKLRATLVQFGKDLKPEEIKAINDEIVEILNGGIEEINTGPILRLKKHTKEATEEMSEFAKQAARNMQDAFADFLFDPFADGLKGMVKGFLDAIRRMLANQAAAQLFKMIGNSFGNSFGGGGGGGFGGARALGGPVQGGKAYVVGERGPEIIVPGGSGTVIPNHALGGVTINNSFEAGVDIATLRSEILPAMEQTQQNSVAEIERRMREGQL